MQSSAENDDTVIALAKEALRLSQAERERFLSLKCKDHEDLYSQVAEVVEWEERMGDFLSQPLIDLINLDEAEEPKKPLQPPQEISDRFFVIREIGEGGMGVVYEAMDRKLGERIAIKCAKPGFRSLLCPELKGALKVSHQNICRVNDTHTEKTLSGEVEFLTMEFIEGETLSARLGRENRLQGEEALNIARQLCAGVAAAHEAGILHRDLKTSNVILSRKEDGTLRAVITDFGLASEARLENGLEGGTPRYMAPELWRDGKPSKASDVYALGVILYELVTGSAPFAARDSWELKNPRPPQSPSLFNKDLDARWDRAILPCLDPDPLARANAADILKRFEKRPLWRSPALPIAMLCLIVLIAAFQQPLMRMFKPADIRLAILPAEADPETAQLADGVLQDVTDRIIQTETKRATISVIPTSIVSASRVVTPEDAARLLHATHAMKMKFKRAGSDTVAEEVVLELKHSTAVGSFSGRYSPAMQGSISAALAAALAGALHLRRSPTADTIEATATAAYDRGLSYIKNQGGTFDDAISEFQQAATQDLHSPLPFTAMAEACLTKFDDTKDERFLQLARDYVAAAAARNPDSISVRMVSGRLDRVTGEYPKALEEFQRVQELDPDNLDSMLEIALLYDVQHMPDKAIQAYRQAIALDPDYCAAYLSFGGFYYERGDYLSAEDQFRKAVERAPGRADAYANLGAALTAQTKYQEAERVLKESLALREDAQNLNNLGATLAYERKDAEAVPYYRHALDLRPGDYRYWINIGDSERRLGHSFGATKAYNSGLRKTLAALANNPQSGPSRAYLAYLKARLGDKVAATQEIRQASKLAGNDNQVILCAILTYVALGETEMAITSLQKASPQLLVQLDHHPDLAEFRNNSRFKEVIAHSVKGG